MKQGSKEIAQAQVEEDEILSDEQDDFQEYREPVLEIKLYSWTIPVIGLAMLAIGLLAGYFGGPLLARQSASAASLSATPTSLVAGATVPTQAQETADTQELMQYLVTQTRHFRGDTNAQVVMIEFSDFQWPYCGSFAAGAGRQIDQKYVQEGKVRFGYWHFAFLGQESLWAAEASECAADQDAFWDYHDLLFERQSGENRGAFTKENLKQFAIELGLDAQVFDQCLDSGKYSDLVQQQVAFAQQIGVQSTPSILINGQPVIGAQPFENFQQVIEQQLSQAGQ